MIECSFCEAIIENTEKLPEGWGRAKLTIHGEEKVNLTFCPKHQKEAEEKLDLVFKKDS